MGIKYDKYINRLKMKRGNDPYYGKVREAAAAFAEPTMAMNREVQGRINTAGGSIGAMEQTRQNAQHQMIQGQKEMISTIPRADTGAIDQQIMELEMRRDAERDQGKDNALKTGLQIGGTALGAIAGTIVAPGPGTLLGAQIGAGLGGTASGFVGGGGDMGMNHASPEVIAQGVADTLEGVSSAVALKDQKALSKTLGENYGDLALEDKELMLGALKAGNLDIVRAILSQTAHAKTYPSDDYDYKGWEGETGKKWNENSGHFPDTYKKPNHITFSTESKLSTGDKMGGKWEVKGGKTYFTPSKYNLSQYSAEQYREYFAKNEPDVILVLP